MRRFTEITVLLADPTRPDASKPGGGFTPDDFDQVVRLKRALSTLDRYRFVYANDHARLLESLRESPPEFALNFCDTGYGNDARKELHLPAYLELLDVPYSGSGPACLGLCFDKSLVRAAAESIGVPVAREAFLAPGDPIPPDVAYPAFVKPNRADGSLGITEHSLVRDASEAEAYAARLRREIPGCEVLVQEFLPGAEFGVGVIGNPGYGFHLLPVLEVDYSGLDAALPRILTYGSKVDPQSPYWTDLRFAEARLDEGTRAALVAHATRLFARLGLRDYGRFDFRAGADGAVRLMEVNPNPAWCWDGKLAHMAECEGKSHGELLGMIIEAAERRVLGAR